MPEAAHQFQLVKFRRPKHPALKRKWPIWFGEALVSEDQRVFIVDVMHPPDSIRHIPPIGSPLCVEYRAYVYIDIDWGINNAADPAERERYTWLKTYALNRAAGKREEPYFPPVYPKVSGRGRKMTLMLEDGRHYEITETRAGFLQTLRHLATKTWADDAFFRLAIERVAAARGWDPEPLRAAINL